MVSITINDVRIEGETLKDAQRLARKEEKRQGQAEKERLKKVDQAKVLAFTEIGKLAQHPNRRNWLYPAKASYVRTDNRYWYVRGDEQSPVEYTVAARPTCLLRRVDGPVYGMRIQYTVGDFYWLSLGAFDGVTTYEVFPDALSAILEIQYQSEPKDSFWFDGEKQAA